MLNVFENGAKASDMVCTRVWGGGTGTGQVAQAGVAGCRVVGRHLAPRSAGYLRTLSGKPCNDALGDGDHFTAVYWRASLGHLTLEMIG